MPGESWPIECKPEAVPFSFTGRKWTSAVVECSCFRPAWMTRLRRLPRDLRGCSELFTHRCEGLILKDGSSEARGKKNFLHCR